MRVAHSSRPKSGHAGPRGVHRIERRYSTNAGRYGSVRVLQRVGGHEQRAFGGTGMRCARGRHRRRQQQVDRPRRRSGYRHSAICRHGAYPSRHFVGIKHDLAATDEPGRPTSRHVIRYLPYCVRLRKVVSRLDSTALRSGR